MREIEPPFELEIDGILLKVYEHDLESKRVFHVRFSDQRKPLVLAVGLDFRGDKFWTAVPPVAGDLPVRIGKLIAEYIRAKRK